ncbi:MAG: nucleotide exchange factor GrpE [Pseudomonadota bacterium]
MAVAGKSAEELAAEDAAAAIRADEAADAAEEAINDALADEGDAEAASAWENPPGGDERNYEAVIGALQDELEAMREMRLRDAAEMENLRRRTAREILDAKKYAVSGFARDLLSVADNMNRAQAAVADEEKAAASEVWRNLLEGVEMTERELLSVFEKNGLRKIDPKGEKFDPNRHQAMFEVPDPSQPAGMVTEVVAAGFVLGERVLRPAMVGVSKGGPKLDVKVEKASSPASDDGSEVGASVDKSA